ncbi:MAG: MBL fold metallo-hydrolase [Lachnospiraceae bacterium]|nr:MBL fold metallo-hydrolase [Lachnospiraceae bacterium]
MIHIHRIKCGNANCYILEENESAVLVDTGKIEHRKEIEKKINRFPIKLIILTHAHFDHCQNADYFSKLYQVPIAMNKKDVDLIQNQMSEKLFAKTILGKVVLKASIASFKTVEMDFAPAVFLDEGVSLEQYGVCARVISLPGHTKGSIGIDCKEAGVIVGDALMNMFYPTISMLYGSENMMLHSAEKITKLGNVLVYFGHGKPVQNRVWKNGK